MYSADYYGKPQSQTHESVTLAGGERLVAEDEAGDIWVVEGSYPEFRKGTAEQSIAEVLNAQFLAMQS